MNLSGCSCLCFLKEKKLDVIRHTCTVSLDLSVSLNSISWSFKLLTDAYLSTTAILHSTRAHTVNERGYVTFNPWGVVQVKIQTQCQRDAVVPGEGGWATMQQTMHLKSKWISSMACALGSYCVGSPLSAMSTKDIKKNNFNLLTNIKAGASTPSQMMIPINWTKSSPISIVILEKESHVTWKSD